MRLRRTAGKLIVGARVELHYLTAPVDVLYERIRRRAQDPPIARADLERRAESFQAPTREEQALFDVTLVLDQRAVGED